MLLTYYNEWNQDKYNKFIKNLYILKDKSYQDFNKINIKTKYKIIGIRVPIIKKICKNISKTNYIEYINCKSNNIYEEILIKGLLLSYLNNYNTFIYYLDKYIKNIDNWALCDIAIYNYKIIIKNKDKMYIKIKEYLNSNNPFIVRVGIVILLKYYNEDKYINKIFDLIKNIDIHTYYIDMAIGWLIEELFIINKDKVIKFITNKDIDIEIKNISIKKIRESKRIDKYYKDILLQ